ncbi:MAG TPA: hypothetical protein VJV23_02175 [Candidatus Polarisedimenticolia bacterium]|nr:hypothetical protein [Candidatus Polarisedimenticolia bacterium]
MDIRFVCPSCGKGSPALAIPSSGGLPSRLTCPSCRSPLPVRTPEAARPGPLAVCPLCGDDKLYVRKDLDQKVGCAVIAAGAALVPWTYGLSLAVCAAADWILYRALPTVTVCYVCAARYRGFAGHPGRGPYDLMAAQTWEARALHWKRANDRSGAGRPGD